MSCSGCNDGCSDCGGLECGTGPAGLDGQNAFTVTTGTFLQPAFGDPAITINVSALGQSTGKWAGVGQWIFIVGAGFFKVVTSTTTTALTVIVPSATIQTYNYTLAANGATIAIGAGVSPAGIEGTGTTGTAGAAGVSVLVQNISVSSPTAIGSGYSAVVFSNANTFGSFTVPAAALVTAGDMLRIEVTFQNDTDLEFGTTASPIIFTGEMLFGGTQVWEGVVGYGDSSLVSNGRVLKLDLIVTATDTLTSKVSDSYGLYGSRIAKWAFSKASSWLFYSSVQVPATNASGVAIGPITPNLANTNLISFRLKNSSNNPIHLASITSVSVIKYKI